MEMTRPIEFVRDFNNGGVVYRKGHVMAEPMSAAWADVLVVRGFARYWDPMPHPARKAKLEQPMGKPRRKRRKRV